MLDPLMAKRRSRYILATLLFCLSCSAASAQVSRTDDPPQTTGSPQTTGPPQTGKAIELVTVAEKSDYQSTATYEEVMTFCKRLAEQSPRVHLTSFGKTVENRSLPLLVIADPPLDSAAAVKASGKLPVFVMANIHAGEVCGKEATLMLAREYAGDAGDELLDRLVLLIAPIYNADGNQRFSKTNRGNQLGPANGMGQRHNMQDLDLNRDHIKLESPEARSLAKLITDWNPAILIDTHTTNGSHHQYTVTYDGPRNPATPGNLIEFTRDELLPAIGKDMQQQSGYLSFYYGNFDEPHQQWDTYPDWPRYSIHYFGMRGRIGILSEAYSYASYKDRVLATKQFVASCCKLAHERHAEIGKLVEDASGDLSPGDDVAIRSELVPLKKRFDVLGYVEQQNDEGKWIATDEHRTYPGVRFVGRSQATKSVVAPFAYVVPAQLTNVIENLRQHGIQLETLDQATQFDVESYRVEKITRAEREFQGHRHVTLEATRSSSKYKSMTGDVIVKVTSRSGALVVNLLEPHSQDGLVTWNFFDEQIKEGEDFPVVRLMQDPAASSPLVTPPSVTPPSVTPQQAAQSSDSQSSDSKPKDDPPSNSPEPSSQKTSKQTTNKSGIRITPEVWYGRRRPNLSGSPMSVTRWIDEESFLVNRDGQWKAVDAKSGESREYLPNAAALRSSITAATGASHRSSRSKVSAMLRQLDEDDPMALFSHDGDLFSMRIDRAAVKRLTSTPAEEEVAAMSPDNNWVAFVRNNNLYSLEVATGREFQLTSDGNRVQRYGKADWVYYEEIYNRNWKGYRFSPDSRHIAFMHYDDSPVRDFNVIDHSTPRTEVEIERYPKAGDPIPRVRLGIVRATGGRIRWIDLSSYSADNMILTRFGWYPDSDHLYVMVQDRAQKWMDFNRASAATGSLDRLFRETSDYWVPDPGPLHISDDGSLLVKSDKDGWRHLYRISPGGKRGEQITTGDWEVRSVIDVDEAEGWIYFMATQDSHLAENFYRARLDGDHEIERLTMEAGRHRVKLSPDRKLFVDTFSALDQPTQVVLREVGSSWNRTLDDNHIKDLEKYALSDVELHEVELAGDYHMPLILSKPLDFEPNQKYPVWIMTYGGPHAPTVSNSWSGNRRGYDQMLNELGIVTVHCDPRSASGQGPQSAWTAYRQLGVQETEDLEGAVEWLVGQGFVDEKRIGLAGHSYGGYLTAFAMTHSKKFAAGIAGAPVTDWRNYDAFYTERYMDTPQENPDGYAAASVLSAAKNLHGALLLLHGAKDDNVHVQNTLQLAQKLQDNGKRFEMMIYPTYRHGIFGKHYNELRLDFIRRAFGL